MIFTIAIAISCLCSTAVLAQNYDDAYRKAL